MNCPVAVAQAKLRQPKPASAPSPRGLAPLSAAHGALPQTSACVCGGGCPRCQAKLAIGAADDPLEREADRIAERVVRIPDTDARPPRLSALRPRRCAACAAGEVGAARPLRRAAVAPARHSPGDATARVPQALQAAGQPLDEATRSYFEPRFGRDFTGVRVHTDGPAADSAAELRARAYTVGTDIVFGAGEYAPQSAAGRHLLAHELAHVVQQGAGGAPATVRRQAIGASCAAHQSLLEEALAEGRRLTSATISTLDNTLQALGMGVAPAPFIATALFNAFGDVGLQPGDLTFLPELIRRYRAILGGFGPGRTLRCDPESVPSTQNECDWRSAFVVVGDSTNIFLCPAFFARDVSVTSRGLTLLHEMAHSVLRIGHTGIPERTFPEGFFDCSIPLGLEWEDARRNAFAFDRLADCLHGERPSSQVEARPAEPSAPVDPRWSISAGAGADVTPDAYRFASLLSGRVSLNTGEFAIFNPVIGFNLLYLPPSDLNTSHLAAATAEMGLRIQQPLEGFYFDVSAGGYAGFDIDPARGTAAEFVGGPTGAVGLGWRFRHLEIGPEARALVPEGDFERTQVLVFGRAAWRFEGP